MPMEEKYFEGLKSQIARIQALVVVDQLLPHSSQAVRQRNPRISTLPVQFGLKENGYNTGATGYGVRTLVNWVLSNVKSEVAAPPK